MRRHFGDSATIADVGDDIDSFRQYFDKPVDRSLELTLEIENSADANRAGDAVRSGPLYAPPIEWNDAMPMMNWLASAEQVHWKLRDPDTGKENMDIGWEASKSGTSSRSESSTIPRPSTR